MYLLFPPLVSLSVKFVLGATFIFKNLDLVAVRRNENRIEIVQNYNKRWFSLKIYAVK